jgi:ABC-type anion transport system duplicated permease subunit
VVPVLLPVVHSGYLRTGVGGCWAGFVASELLSVVR